MQNKTNQFLMIAFLLAVTFFSLPLKAQVTIGSLTTPDPNAVLELVSNTKLGLLLPRLNLKATNDPSPMTANVEGMLVYNLVSDGTDPNKVVPGLYYNDGTQWVLVVTGNGGLTAEADGVIGNEVTDAADKTLFRTGSGTIADPYKMRVAATTDGAGYGIGTDNIQDGAVTGAKIAPKTINVSNINGSTTAGQVPTTDADGNVTWQTPSGGSDYVAFKGQVYTTTDLTYTVPDDAYAVMTMAPSAVTITMPVLTAADKGRTIYVMNNNTGGTSNQFDPSVIGTGTNQNPFRGSVFIWFGDKWVSFSK